MNTHKLRHILIKIAAEPNDQLGWIDVGFAKSLNDIKRQGTEAFYNSNQLRRLLAMLRNNNYKLRFEQDVNKGYGAKLRSTGVRQLLRVGGISTDRIRLPGNGPELNYKQFARLTELQGKYLKHPNYINHFKNWGTVAEWYNNRSGADLIKELEDFDIRQNRSNSNSTSSNKPQAPTKPANSTSATPSKVTSTPIDIVRI